jgi:F420-dependent oxidoreductase-like protein
MDPHATPQQHGMALQWIYTNRPPSTLDVNTSGATPVQIHGDRIRVGLHSGQQYATFVECLGVWQRAEALGYDWVSIFDHFRPPLGGRDGPCLEGTTLLAALATATSRVRCGFMVSPVTWRHPAITAAAAATIDQISGGRLEFGLGAGGGDLGYEQYGIPFPDARQRLAMLDETCRILRGLWTRETTTFTGRHYRLTEAHLEPKPVQERLPLVIGGEGERRMLRIVAEHADIWNTLAGTPDIYRRKLDALARLCHAADRDPADIRRSVTFRAVLDDTGHGAEARAREIFGRLPADSPDHREYLVVGTPEDCVDRLAAYMDLGVGDFLLGARPPVDWHTVELFAQKVAPALRAGR